LCSWAPRPRGPDGPARGRRPPPRALRPADPVDHAAAVVGHVQLAAVVLAERRDVEAGLVQQRDLPRAAGEVGAPDPAGDEVAEDVGAPQLGHGAAAVEVAAADRAAPAAAAGVGDDRHHQALGVAAGARLEALGPLHHVPAVVLAARGAGGLQVHLLEPVLADVGDVKVAGLAVEAEAPRVAQAVGPDLGPGALAVHEGVVWRRDGALAGDVEPEELAEYGVEALAVALRVAAAAAVSEPEVEVAVGTEGELTAVVVGVRLDLGEQDLLAGGVGDVARGREARQHRVAVVVGVVDVEAPRRRVVLGERQAEEAALAAAADAVGDVEERLLQDRAVPYDADRASLLADEQPVVVSVGDDH